MRRKWKNTQNELKRKHPKHGRYTDSGAMKEWCQMEWDKIKTHNKIELHREFMNFKDDGLYIDHHKHSARWNFW